MNVVQMTLKRKNRQFILEFTSGNLDQKLELLRRTLAFVLWYLFLIPLTVIVMPFAIIFAALFDSLVKIRIGKLTDDRIGHLAHDTDLYLRRLYGQKKSWKEYHVMLSDKVVNIQLLTMIKRRLWVLESPFFLRFYKAAHLWTSWSRIWVNLYCDYSAFCEYRDVPAQLSFTPEEEEKGKVTLRQMGIEHDAPFVCLHARDQRYLKEGYVGQTGRDWKRHDYRNSDIRNCKEAANYLASQGVYVFRMGHKVALPLAMNNERIIDYAIRYRSDFMDIYLTGHCKFFLGDTAGLHCVALALGVPIAVANWIPLKYTPPGKHDIFIPKKLWLKEQKRFLTFREILSSGMDQWEQTEHYRKAGIEVIANTADEILALAREMDARINRTWKTTAEDEELQQRFRSIYLRGYYSYGFNARIGAEFLRQNRELLELRGFVKC